MSRFFYTLLLACLLLVTGVSALEYEVDQWCEEEARGEYFADNQYYCVSSGDTFSEIYVDFAPSSLNKEEFADINDIPWEKRDTIYVGQRLYFNDSSKFDGTLDRIVSSLKRTFSSCEGDREEYTVEKGDTMYAIYNEIVHPKGFAMSQFLDWNKDRVEDFDKISPGDELIVGACGTPATKSSGSKGDTSISVSGSCPAQVQDQAEVLQEQAPSGDDAKMIIHCSDQDPEMAYHLSDLATLGTPSRNVFIHWNEEDKRFSVYGKRGSHVHDVLAGVDVDAIDADLQQSEEDSVSEGESDVESDQDSDDSADGRQRGGATGESVDLEKKVGEWASLVWDRLQIQTARSQTLYRGELPSPEGQEGGEEQESFCILGSEETLFCQRGDACDSGTSLYDGEISTYRSCQELVRRLCQDSVSDGQCTTPVFRVPENPRIDNDRLASLTATRMAGSWSNLQRCSLQDAFKESISSSSEGEKGMYLNWERRLLHMIDAGGDVVYSFPFTSALTSLPMNDLQRYSRNQKFSGTFSLMDISDVSTAQVSTYNLILTSQRDASSLSIHIPKNFRKNPQCTSVNHENPEELLEEFLSEAQVQIPDLEHTS